MAALEEFELGIDHVRNAFKRANNGFTNAYKMLEAQRQKNHKLEAENAKLRELVMDMFNESSLTRERFAPTLIELGVCTEDHITTYYGIEV